jgi:hypothetical protein
MAESATCEVSVDGPCAEPGTYTVAVEDTTGEEMSIAAAFHACGYHLQDAVDHAVALDPNDEALDVDEYFTVHERRVTVARRDS